MQRGMPTLSMWHSLISQWQSIIPWDPGGRRLRRASLRASPSNGAAETGGQFEELLGAGWPKPGASGGGAAPAGTARTGAWGGGRAWES